MPFVRLIFMLVLALAVFSLRPAVSAFAHADSASCGCCDPAAGEDCGCQPECASDCLSCVSCPLEQPPLQTLLMSFAAAWNPPCGTDPCVFDYVNRIFHPPRAVSSAHVV